MKQMTFIDGRPEEPLGFALWFDSAYDDARLTATQFWYPAVGPSGEDALHSAIALGTVGQIRRREQDRAPKAVAVFAVSALIHLIETNGQIPFSYEGPCGDTIFSALRLGKARCTSIDEMFGNAQKNLRVSVPGGEEIDRVFIQAGGSAGSPKARLGVRFQQASNPDGLFTIHVFWTCGRLDRPDWQLPRIVDTKTLSHLVAILERPFCSKAAQEDLQIGDLPNERDILASATTPPYKASLVLGESGCEDTVAQADDRDIAEATLPTEEMACIAKRNFLRLVICLIMGKQSSLFPTHWVSRFLSDDVKERLPDSADAEQIITLCNSLLAIDASYKNALLALGNDWTRLKAAVKLEIRNYLEKSILRKDLALLPPLQAEDTKDLEIEWNKADWEYGQRTQEAFAKCRELGFDVANEVIARCHLNEVQDVLAALLKQRAEIDIAHVSAAGAQSSWGNRCEILNRATTECTRLKNLLGRAMARECGRPVAQGAMPMDHFLTNDTVIASLRPLDSRLHEIAVLLNVQAE